MSEKLPVLVRMTKTPNNNICGFARPAPYWRCGKASPFAVRLEGENLDDDDRIEQNSCAGHLIHTIIGMVKTSDPQ